MPPREIVGLTQCLPALSPVQGVGGPRASNAVQVGGEGVAEGVTGGALGDARLAHSAAHGLLEDGLVQVVATAGAERCSSVRRLPQQGQYA
jgi:hypothetical protein